MQIRIYSQFHRWGAPMKAQFNTWDSRLKFEFFRLTQVAVVVRDVWWLLQLHYPAERTRLSVVRWQNDLFGMDGAVVKIAVVFDTPDIACIARLPDPEEETQVLENTIPR
jgi:hypothetical protein